MIYKASKHQHPQTFLCIVLFGFQRTTRSSSGRNNSTLPNSQQVLTTKLWRQSSWSWRGALQFGYLSLNIVGAGACRVQLLFTGKHDLRWHVEVAALFSQAMGSAESQRGICGTWIAFRIGPQWDRSAFLPTFILLKGTYCCANYFPSRDLSI